MQNGKYTNLKKNIDAVKKLKKAVGKLGSKYEIVEPMRQLTKLKIVVLTEYYTTDEMILQNEEIFTDKSVCWGN